MSTTTAIALLTGDALRRELDAVAGLLAAAYPPQAIRMDRSYLEWILADLGPEHRPVAALARRGSELVGFAGAAPATFVVEGTTETGWIVSWVAVHPGARGGRLAVRLYQHLLGRLAELGPGPIHTFAQAGTTGAALIEACYPAAGWHGRELAPLHGWGALRRRIRPVTETASTAAPGPDTTTLVAGVRFRERLEHDPRRPAAATTTGARVVAVSFNDPGQDAVGAIELLAADPDPALVVEAVHTAMTALPEAITRLVIPNLPASAEASAAAIGFRRLPAPAWRNWVYSRDPDAAALRAARTAVPVI